MESLQEDVIQFVYKKCFQLIFFEKEKVREFDSSVDIKKFDQCIESYVNNSKTVGELFQKNILRASINMPKVDDSLI